MRVFKLIETYDHISISKRRLLPPCFAFIRGEDGEEPTPRSASFEGKKYLQEDIRSKGLTDDAPVARKLVKRKLK